MHNLKKFYINGQWVEPSGSDVCNVHNPATDEIASQICLGDQVDVDRAVDAAVIAFDSFSKTDKAERVALLERIIKCYEERAEELAIATTEEMGAPIVFSRQEQVGAGLMHVKVALSVLKKTDFSEAVGTATIVKEPVGVCGMITPWNWP
ncbi:MAG: aldehyde dehydrogenase family protein, partial [Oceanospirillaceae bacterium]|nr:aldehyde dehydrogenase family protein [Oceanospirillaceae bacterium]